MSFIILNFKRPREQDRKKYFHRCFVVLILLSFLQVENIEVECYLKNLRKYDIWNKNVNPRQLRHQQNKIEQDNTVTTVHNTT